MQGKYGSYPRYVAAYVNREAVRLKLRRAVSWGPLARPERGCTAIVGMCHRLPGVLLSNLRCLMAAAWPALKRVIVVVDGAEGCVAKELEAKARRLATDAIAVDIFYYSPEQAKLSEELRLPWVFSWLSWSIAYSHCRTRHALIHDYDALVFGDVLQRRYDEFVASRAAIQGIRWYKGNGVELEDRLATTFEAFVDVTWIRAHHPLAGFHKVAYHGGVSRDYDTLLHLQHVHTRPERRTTMGMPEESLVHPSQMIHQYTMCRRLPGEALPCASLPMIPFFEFLSGDSTAIDDATRRLEERDGKVANLLGDGIPVNLTELDVLHVDWDLKQMVQACMLSHVEPFAGLHRYGVQLYEVCGAGPDRTWVGDFTESQRQWIERCRLASGSTTDATTNEASHDGTATG